MPPKILALLEESLSVYSCTSIRAGQSLLMSKAHCGGLKPMKSSGFEGSREGIHSDGGGGGRAEGPRNEQWLSERPIPNL